MVGSSVAWYSWFLFSSGAIYISTAFLPRGNEATSVIETLGVFAAGFLVRPFGAVIFGHYGDTKGRKKMLLLTVLLCSASSLTIGAMPGYSLIGNKAIILVVVAYLVLGFSLGGEWGGSLLLMMENAKEDERASRSSYAQATIGIGLLLGAVTYYALGGILSSAEMLSYGWRIPFLIGFPLGVTALIIRSRVTETKLFHQVEAERLVARVPVANIVRHHKRTLAIGTLIVGSSGTMFYVGATLLPVVFELLKVVTIQSAQIGISLLASSEIVAVFAGGVISDKIGRRPMIWLGNAGLLILAYPAFYLQSGTTFFACMALFGMTHGIQFAPLGATISESFPTSIRATGNSLTYHLGNSLISGPASFFSALMGSVAFFLYPVYAVFWALVAIGAVSVIPETKDSILDTRTAEKWERAAT
jgi:MFS transporter, MHS family, shikimate and dehydroshikimate transport protein